VTCGDLWSASWRGLALVYLFQRPESMGRAWAKAEAELAPGAWLVSLEFVVPGREPTTSIVLPGGRTLHAWQIGDAAAALKRPLPAPINPAQAPIVRRVACSSS
jgi:hypothetical protein